MMDADNNCKVIKIFSRVSRKPGVYFVVSDNKTVGYILRVLGYEPDERLVVHLYGPSALTRDITDIKYGLVTRDKFECALKEFEVNDCSTYDLCVLPVAFNV